MKIIQVISKGTFFQKQVSVTKLDLPQLGLLSQTLPALFQDLWL